MSLIATRPGPGAARAYRFPQVVRRTAAGGQVVAAHLPGQNLAVALLLLDGGAIVEGWLSAQFLGTRTYWTWEPAHCRVSQFMGGVTPRVLCGCVEPIAWAPKDPPPMPAEAKHEVEELAA